MKNKTQWTAWGVLDCLVLHVLDQDVWFQSHWNPTKYRKGKITGISETKATLLQRDGVTVTTKWENIYT